MTVKLIDPPPAFAGIIGIGRRDITPPVGIYARIWGAASHDRSEGTHRPLSVTASVFRRSPDDTPLVLVSIDLALLGDLGGEDGEGYGREGVMEAFDLPASHLMVACTHTHSSPWCATSRADLPGGELIKPYLKTLRDAITEATREAIATAQHATLTWATGRCDLAVNRDLPDPDASKDRIVCGYNPEAKADDAVLVGRITRDADARVLGTIVNYACHPTTLAWDNRLVSPDFIGAMRELVEQYTRGAPCLFLQGASGELSPAHQYVGDVSVADRHGRRLGFAVLSALVGMLDPGQAMAFDRVVESGAPLAVWAPRAFEVDQTLEVVQFHIDYPLIDYGSVADIDATIAACTDRMMGERLRRKRAILVALGDAKTYRMPTWVWRLGTSLIVGHSNEAYSDMQIQLRAAFADCAVAVVNVVNGEIGYLPPRHLYDKDIYQVWQTPFAPGSLDMLIEQSIARGRELMH